MIDISLPVHQTMLHGGPRPTKTMVESIAAGDPGNVSRWVMSAHAGTHVEAPLHVVADGATVDALGLDLLVGPARVLDLTGVEGEITAADLEAAGLADDARVLLRTRNSDTVLQESEKADAWVGLAPDAARLLVDRGAKLVGVDYLTVETPAREATFDAHAVLCAAGVAIVEAVDLRNAPAGVYELICLPLLLRGSEAAPARAMLRELPANGARAGALRDLSVPLHGDMLHWGRKPEKTVVEALDQGDRCNVTRWLIGSHTGTHVDAQLHFVDGGKAVETLELERLVGPARVLDLTHVEKDITAADLEAAGLADEERVLLKTRNSTGALRVNEKGDEWVALTPEGAQLLVDRGVRLVAIDFLTIDAPERASTWDTHLVLCGADVTILECADLLDVPAGVYELVCLPIPLHGSEAAPGRAYLRELDGAAASS